MPDPVDTHDQLIIDATAKARKLTADLEHDANDMASADTQGRRLIDAARASAQALLDELTRSQIKQK